MTFLHPERICVGRLRLEIPGPGIKVTFLSSDVNGINVNRVAIPVATSFLTAWDGYAKEQARSGLKVVRQDRLTNTRVVLLSSPNLSGGLEADLPDKKDQLTIWQQEGAGALQVNGWISAGASAAATRDMMQVLDHYRTESAGPAAPGFCVDGGYIVDVGEGGEGVRASVIVPLPPGPERVSIIVTTDVVTGFKADDLLERAKAMGTVAGMRVLRRGERSVAEMNGHEYVQVSPDRDRGRVGRYVFAAAFEFGGAANRVDKPRTSIRIDGTSLPDSITPAQMLTLWEAILSGVTSSR